MSRFWLQAALKHQGGSDARCCCNETAASARARHQCRAVPASRVCVRRRASVRVRTDVSPVAFASKVMRVVPTSLQNE
eukprot:11228300-Lingulodinium_polyedra.AAC.1